MIIEWSYMNTRIEAQFQLMTNVLGTILVWSLRNRGTDEAYRYIHTHTYICIYDIYLYGHRRHSPSMLSLFLLLYYYIIHSFLRSIKLVIWCVCFWRENFFKSYIVCQISLLIHESRYIVIRSPTVSSSYYLYSFFWTFYLIAHFLTTFSLHAFVPKIVHFCLSFQHSTPLISVSYM